MGTFFSTGSQGGGQETTAMSTMPFFSHMGMIYVPLGNKFHGKPEPGVVAGGSAWGAGTIAGHGKIKYNKNMTDKQNKTICFKEIRNQANMS